MPWRGREGLKPTAGSRRALVPNPVVWILFRRQQAATGEGDGQAFRFESPTDWDTEDR